MKKIILGISLFNKYIHLLIALVLLLMVGPIFSKFDLRIQLFPCFFLGVVILALRALNLKRPLYFACVLIALMAFLLHSLIGTPVLISHKQIIIILSNSVHAIFIIISISVFIIRIFSEKEVTVDIIQGGISIYLLMGFLWILLYHIVVIADPEAFSITISESSMGFIFLYFSFTTLTTLGYGDIIPKSEWSMMLSILEAVTGQIFLAIFIARLVGLHIAHHFRKVKNTK